MVSLKYFGVVILFGEILFFSSAYAEADDTTIPVLFSNIGTFGDYIVNKVGSFMFTVLIATAVIFVIYAAYLYLLSEGDPEKTKTALNTLVYALFAIVIALISRSLVFVVKNFFG